MCHPEALRLVLALPESWLEVHFSQAPLRPTESEFLEPAGKKTRVGLKVFTLEEIQ